MAARVGALVLSALALLAATSLCIHAAPCSDLPSLPPDTASTATFCVDSSGCCNFTTVQAAVDAIPDNSPKRSVVWINSGTYMEKLLVPATKTNVTFQGQGMASTILVWNDTSASANGTGASASVHVKADGFVGKNITFRNSSPPPNPGDQNGQAVALRIEGDRAAFWGCGFFGAQDTLYDDKERHYFKECFIQGSIDFIFGNGRSLYEDCTLNSIANIVPKGKPSITGFVTAQAREFPDNNTGFSFVNCEIKGTGYILLGRPWKPYARVIFAKTSIPNIVAPEGWGEWGNSKAADSTVFFGEYRCYGVGSKTDGRVKYAKQLDDSEAQQYMGLSYVDGEDWIKSFNDSLIVAS